MNEKRPINLKRPLLY